MRLMRLFGAAALWACGVLMVASLSWVAINSAGRQVVDEAVAVGDVVPSGSEPFGGGSTEVTPTSGPTGAGPNRTVPVPTPATAPSGTPSPITPPAATAARVATRTAGVSASPSVPETRIPTSSPQLPETSPPQAPPPGPVSALRVTAGGTLWVECTGSVMSDYISTPEDGWSGTRSQHGPAEVHATFVRNRTEIEVRAACRAGQPSFSVDTEERDGDNHR